MIFDTHAHYEDESFDEDRGTLLAGMRENNVGRIVNVGSTLETSEASIELAKQYDDIYASVGIHPSEVTFPIKGADEGAMTMDESRRMIPDIMSKLEDMSSYDKCVAIGEIGLDYYWDKEPENHALQREWFLAQLELANKVNKPVIVHSREASQETFDILTTLDGKVSKITKDELLGNVVEITHSPSLITTYYSIDNIKVVENQTLKQGDIIGTSGKNNISSTSDNMLLFEVSHNGNNIDPENYYQLKIEDLEN